MQSRRRLFHCGFASIPKPRMLQALGVKTGRRSPMQRKDLISTKILRYPSESKLHMYRTLSYSAAGISLILIALLAQIWKPSKALNLSLYCAAIALPFWILLGTIYEYYILLGKQSYGHYRSTNAQIFIFLGYLGGGVPLLIALGSLLYSVNSRSLTFFVLALVATLVIALAFTSSLTSFLKGNESDGS